MSWFLSECDIFCVLQYHSEIRELCRRLKQQQHDFAEQEQAICHNQNVQRQKIRDLKDVRYCLIFYLQFIFNSVNGQTS